MFIFVVIVLVHLEFAIPLFSYNHCGIFSAFFPIFFLICLGLLLIQTKRSHVSVQVFFKVMYFCLCDYCPIPMAFF